MPKNYREWSADVNLISDQVSRRIAHLSDVTDGATRATHHLHGATFRLGFIGLSVQYIHHDRVFRVSLLIAGARKPCFGGQKDKNQDHHTKNVPLPRSAWVIPKQDLLCHVPKVAHYLFIDDVAIAHLDDSLTSGGCFRIVRNHDDRLIKSIIKLAKHFQNDFRVF